ncbi:hypothetical protein M011DRAFT_455802 [Sporormia fimetaria CBS 119925]|uniref:Uncharacterized protein n=1 Tax=Sporormia fimetaria CBS 119925 TaxID=1340428 RepID=A0A6A6VJM6_9PLEO|nr:hypothetical protein M011DRAFT_455802 [Sporormia fimetaria CBS 119925]
MGIITSRAHSYPFISLILHPPPFLTIVPCGFANKISAAKAAERLVDACFFSFSGPSLGQWLAPQPCPRSGIAPKAWRSRSKVRMEPPCTFMPFQAEVGQGADSGTLSSSTRHNYAPVGARRVEAPPVIGLIIEPFNTQDLYGPSAQGLHGELGFHSAPSKLPMQFATR